MHKDQYLEGKKGTIRPPECCRRPTGGLPAEIGQAYYIRYRGNQKKSDRLCSCSSNRVADRDRRRFWCVPVHALGHRGPPCLNRLSSASRAGSLADDEHCPPG